MAFWDNIFTKSDDVRNKELVQKGLELERLETSVRPMGEDPFVSTNAGRYGTLGSFGVYVSPWELYELFLYSDILRNCATALRNEIFRNGFDFLPVEKHVGEEQKNRAEKFFKVANQNNQSLKEVLGEFEDDLNWADDAYLLFLKDYLLNGNKELIGGKATEVLRINPLLVEMMLDKSQRLGYNNKAEKIYFSVFDRKELTTNEINKEGIPNLRAHYKIRTADGDMYYNKSEILHCSKYRPTKTYGFSPLYSLYNKLVILIAQDNYIKKYYANERPPKKLLFINTRSKESLLAMWNKLKEKVKHNPHQLFPIPVESPEGSKDPAQVIDLMNNLQEMQYTEVRNEIRQQVGAVYGVSPIFMNDTSQGGGLNNEGLQITVTNRAVEFGQKIYNEKVLPFIFDQLGITDYDVILAPSEEKDEIKDLEIQAVKIRNAKELSNSGLDVRYTEEGEFEIMAGELKAAQDMFSEFDETDNNSQEDEKKDTTENAGTPDEPDNEVDKGIPVRKGIKTTLQKELEKLVKGLDYKRKPSVEQLNKKLQSIVENIEKRMRAKSANFFKAIYRQEANKIAGPNYKLDEKDKNVIEALKRDPMFNKAFAGMSLDMSKRVNGVIDEFYNQKQGNFTVDSLVKKLEEETTKTESALRTIARTETSKIQTASRIVSYQKSSDKPFDEMKFKHIGPNDKRTSKVSKEMKELTKNGVTWKEYVTLVKQVSQKHNPKWLVNENAPITHPNTRHVPVRHFE